MGSGRSLTFDAWSLTAVFLSQCGSIFLPEMERMMLLSLVVRFTVSTVTVAVPGRQENLQKCLLSPLFVTLDCERGRVRSTSLADS